MQKIVITYEVNVEYGGDEVNICVEYESIEALDDYLMEKINNYIKNGKGRFDCKIGNLDMIDLKDFTNYDENLKKRVPAMPQISTLDKWFEQNKE